MCDSIRYGILFIICGGLSVKISTNFYLLPFFSLLPLLSTSLFLSLSPSLFLSRSLSSPLFLSVSLSTFSMSLQYRTLLHFLSLPLLFIFLFSRLSLVLAPPASFLSYYADEMVSHLHIVSDCPLIPRPITCNPMKYQWNGLLSCNSTSSFYKVDTFALFRHRDPFMRWKTQFFYWEIVSLERKITLHTLTEWNMWTICDVKWFAICSVHTELVHILIEIDFIQIDWVVLHKIVCWPLLINLFPLLKLFSNIGFNSHLVLSLTICKFIGSFILRMCFSFISNEVVMSFNLEL